MRLARYLLLPAALGFLLSGAEPAVTCCGGPESIKLPTPVPTGIVRGNHFFAVTAEGKLLAVDLAKHDVKVIPDLAKLSPVLDARGDSICVHTGQKLLLVSVSTGKVTRELEIDGNIHSFGFAGDNHLFVHKGNALDLIELKTAKTTTVIALGKPGQVAAIERLATGMVSDPAGKQLYAIVRGDKTGVAVIDVATAKVTAVHPIADSAFRRSYLQIVDNKVFIVNSIDSYGVWIADQFGCLDLKTGKYQPLKLPAGMMGRGTIIPGPGGTMLMTTKTLMDGPDGPAAMFRYDADGKLVGQVRTAGQGALVGFWADDAVTLTKDRLFIGVAVRAVSSK
jgi:hypothetical protein